MKNEIKYELPIFPSNLAEEPYIHIGSMNTIIEIEGG